MKKTITLQINLSKIEKDRIYEGKKGKYLNAVLFYDDQKDEYGQNGPIIQSVSKEERENGVRGNILGNAKTFDNNGSPDNGQLNSNVNLNDVADDVEDDLPF